MNRLTIQPISSRRHGAVRHRSRLYRAVAASLSLILLVALSSTLGIAAETTESIEAAATTTSAAITTDESTAASGNEAEESTAVTLSTAPRTACQVTVRADGKSTTLCLARGSVEGALALAGITLGSADIVSAPLSERITADMTIDVSRVDVQERTETETIAYDTIVRESDSLDAGKTVVETEGQNGEKTLLYHDVYVDGELTESLLISSEVTRKAVDRVVIKGTRKVVSSTVSAGGTTIELDEKGQPITYTALYTGQATAYTATGHGTASGRKAQYGVVAVDPSIIPYGTKLYIVSPDGKYVYGYAVAGDTGGAVRSGRIVVDLYYDTLAECYQFGRRTMNVYVIG